MVVIDYLCFMAEKFEVRNTDGKDYEELCDWWKWHKFTAPPFEILPDDKSHGLMISYNGENICAGFVYATSSKVLFWTEFIVSTYKIKDKKIRKDALLFLIKGLNYMAKEMGAKVIYTNVVNPSLVKRYLESGYIEGSKNNIAMVKPIT